MAADLTFLTTLSTYYNSIIGFYLSLCHLCYCFRVSSLL
nr:MAG TPA: hypothetical protein [Caudoviricetes sp.]